MFQMGKLYLLRSPDELIKQNPPPRSKNKTKWIFMGDLVETMVNIPVHHFAGPP